MKYEFLQPKFTEGVLAKSLQGRSIEEFYHYGYKSSKNMIPVLSGPVVKRPGTNYIGDAKDATAVFIPFFKDKDNTYIIKLGVSSESGHLREWSQDQLLNNKLNTLIDLLTENFKNGVSLNSQPMINNIIKPNETRSELIRGLEMLSSKVDSNPKKKHGNIPL